MQDRAAFLLRAADDAAWALAGPEIGPVLGEVNHDDAERLAMAAFYAEPEQVDEAGQERRINSAAKRPVQPGVQDTMS